MAETCETRVSDRLHNLLSRIPFVRILSWNPPNAKSYHAPNLIFPKIVNGARKGSDRIDVVFETKRVLFLVELKCLATQAEDDLVKLRRVRDTLGLSGVVEAIQRQGVVVDSQVAGLALAVGMEIVDRDAPTDFSFLEIAESAIRVTLGYDVDPQVKGALDDVQGYLAKNIK